MEKYASWDEANSSLGKEQTVVYVTGGGSGFGVKGLMNGTLDVGMVSRDLKDTEIKTLGGPVMHVFARDAVAIATNVANPLAKTKQEFSTTDLAAIFSGNTQQMLLRLFPVRRPHVHGVVGGMDVEHANIAAVLQQINRHAP